MIAGAVPVALVLLGLWLFPSVVSITVYVVSLPVRILLAALLLFGLMCVVMGMAFVATLLAPLFLLAGAYLSSLSAMWRAVVSLWVRVVGVMRFENSPTLNYVVLGGLTLIGLCMVSVALAGAVPKERG